MARSPYKFYLEEETHFGDIVSIVSFDGAGAFVTQLVDKSPPHAIEFLGGIDMNGYRTMALTFHETKDEAIAQASQNLADFNENFRLFCREAEIDPYDHGLEPDPGDPTSSAKHRSRTWEDNAGDELGLPEPLYYVPRDIDAEVKAAAEKRRLAR